MIAQTIVITDHDPLCREVWVFWYSGVGAVLDAWRCESRKTTCHKFTAKTLAGETWQRIDQRANRCDKPKVPSWVVEQALSDFRASIVSAESNIT